MKKHFINIAWIIIVTPFYILLLICCVYSRCLPYLFIPSGTKVKPYHWLDKFDSWVYKNKDRYL